MKRAVSAVIGSRLSCALHDLVVDVGDIAHVDHVEPERPQPAPHDIEHHHDARVPEVAVVVDRHSAHIHADTAWRDRNKFLLFAGKRVIDPEHRVASDAKCADPGGEARSAGSRSGRFYGCCGVRKAEFEMPGVLGRISRF
jgi:hypothetical protein